jgi:hypothetical protein
MASPPPLDARPINRIILSLCADESNVYNSVRVIDFPNYPVLIPRHVAVAPQAAILPFTRQRPTVQPCLRSWNSRPSCKYYPIPSLGDDEESDLARHFEMSNTLTDKALVKFEAESDVWQEALEGVREIKAGKGKRTNV